MPLSSNINVREKNKFRGDTDPETTVAVTLEGDTLTTNGSGEECVRVCGESVPQGLSTLGKITQVAVDDSSWTEVVPSPITGRRGFGIQNTDGTGLDNPAAILLNFSPFAPAGGSVGWKLEAGESKFYDANEGVNIYVRVVAGGGSFNVVFEEIR